MTQYEFTPGSWKVASEPYSEVSQAVSGQMQSVISSSTDAGAIGSASGVSLFDAAVTGVLGGLAQVMGQMASELQSGLASEADALTQTGIAYATTEQNNTVTGGE